MIDKKQLHEIIAALIEVAGEKGLKVSTDTILSEACSYQRGFLAQKSKSNLNPFGKKEDGLRDYGQTRDRSSSSNNKEPATKNQLDYIYRNNLDVDTKNLTKREAHAIIKEFKEQ